jgi:hypothetical protein
MPVVRTVPVVACVALLVAGTTNVGCAGHSGAKGNAATCSTVGPAPQSQLPRLTASGASAMGITQALDAIFASQTPPISLGQAYALPSLSCADVQTGLGNSGGYECALQVQIDGGAPTDVNANAPSALAQNLFNALTAAGATTCATPGSINVTLENATVTPQDVSFDDASQYRSFPAPDVVVRGADAQNVIHSLAAAGIDDCDPSRSVFLICTMPDAVPNCGYQWLGLKTMGSSELVPFCGPGSGPVPAGGTLDSSSSAAIWQSILAAAAADHFQPLNGTIEQTRVINARYFTWDGAQLGFMLVADDATAPPAAHDAGQAD